MPDRAILAPILEGPELCWKHALAEKFTLLVDGDAYFRAFREAALKARHSILILGWDIDSRLELCRDEQCSAPTRLGPLLDHIAARNPELHIHILLWDFAMIYAFDRQSLPLYHFGWRRHRRVHFSLDDRHPFGGSHHQKIIVIDDAVAFNGGIDLAARRWDTPDHFPDDARRFDPGSGTYRPLHDIQAMVEGPAARALGELARDRFVQAGLRRPGPAPETGPSPWPDSFAPELRDVDICIARTVPSMPGQAGVREIETQYIEAIGKARNHIFIENQYLTSAKIGRALLERLSEPQGPEIVILLPHGNAGWLEEATMGVLRVKLMKELHRADRFGRLGVWSPLMRQDGGEVYIKVHAKLMIVDDRYLRIGSANLNNRSMGLDTECDLSLEATEPSGPVQEYIQNLLARLLSEHSGYSLDTVQSILADRGSLTETVKILAEGEIDGQVSPHKLIRPSDGRVDELYEDIFPGSALVDPEHPARPEQYISLILQGDTKPVRPRPLMIMGSIIAGFAAIIILWRFTPLADILTSENIAAYWSSIERSGLAPLFVMAAFLLGGQVVFPITLLIAATAFAFPPWIALGYSTCGSIASALIGYGLGRLFGRDLVRRLGGKRINRISQRLARQGLAAVAFLRVLPVAPFTLVNLVCGASGISLGDFLGGSTVGMVPGIFLFTFLGKSILDAFRNPTLGNILLLVMALVTPVVLAIILQRFMAKKHPAELPSA